MQAFRLKFLRKYLDPNCQSIWKSALDYFITKIENMDLTQNIVFTYLNSKHLKHLPLHYQEMFNAYYRIKSKLKFEIEIQHVYDNPIFCNPNIKLNDKMLLFEKFIHTGLIQIKDICYEVIPGFFTSGSIVEIIQQNFPDEKPHEIKAAYDKILRCIPETWKILLKSINPLNTESIPKLRICLENDREVPFLGAVTKLFYKLLLSEMFETPTAEKHWAEKYPSINFTKLYSVTNQNGLPPDCHCLNYRMVRVRVQAGERVFPKVNEGAVGTARLAGFTKEEINFTKKGMIALNILADVLYDLLKPDKPNLRPRNDCDITYLYSEHRKLNKHIPSNSWGGTWLRIQTTDIAIGDDIERIRLTRNELQHSQIFNLEDKRFNELSNILSDLLKRFDHHNTPTRLYTDKLNDILAKNISAEEVKSIENEISGKYTLLKVF
ncbi:unnamed protein product [Mytilus coruscus]|uniref:Uncharacterized protein n=1 Tax=Mytilus coruscus TaxID=42192 RepID=A0A6J8AFW8_MYTCO|nr:unnamed protein product [Mytilus coruscus]